LRERKGRAKEEESCSKREEDINHEGAKGTKKEKKEKKEKNVGL